MSTEPTELTSSDLAVLESLQGSTESISQRELARRTGLSVGLINAVIKKLVQTGLIKTSHLNRRQFEYLLTPEGFTHAALKSYHYIVDTARGYQAIQVKLRKLLDGLIKEGSAAFYLHGTGELAELVALFFTEEGLGEIRCHHFPERNEGVVLLNASPEALKAPGFRIVDLVKELGNGKGNGEKRSETQEKKKGKNAG